ncbi:hypothetical protein [Streptomyces sp. NPDC005538]|uniref:hypothetical protein n=1 Tax=unclassified Streptomyces TaxID=2593676 RepID=UPI0033A0DC8A
MADLAEDKRNVGLAGSGPGHEQGGLDTQSRQEPGPLHTHPEGTPLPAHGRGDPTALRAQADHPVPGGELKDSPQAPRDVRHEQGAPHAHPGGRPLPDYTRAHPTSPRARANRPVSGAELEDSAQAPQAGRPEPGRREDESRTPAPHPDRTPLPDYTGVDLTALRTQVDHPVLGAVLATLLARSCHADGGLVAYHEDSPGAER